MTRGQRWIILIGVPIVAWMLHVSFCDWQWKGPRGGGAIVLRWEHAETVNLGINTTPPLPPGFKMPATEYSGLFHHRDVAAPIAVLSGVILPAVLLATVAWLWLGWRRANRIANGLCIKCGHDLRGVNHDKCPECGAAVKTPAATQSNRQTD